MYSCLNLNSRRRVRNSKRLRREAWRRSWISFEKLEPRLVLAIQWSGDIPDGTIWRGSDIHHITADVRVPAGATLTIEPGAIVKFGAFHYDLQVEGTLTAIGTSANRIVFTEFRDDVGGDTNADGAVSSPSRGNWGRIEVLAAGSATLEQADIRYGGFGSVGLVTVTGGSFTLRDSTISFSSVGGLRVNTANPTLQNNRFEDNTNAAVSMDLASSPAITGGSYSDNAVNGVFLDAGTLTADSTWNNPDAVYMLSGDVTVPAGTTLTIGAGQIIKTFSTSGFIVTSNILVNGRLLSQGTTQKPVIVTSRRDDSVGGNTTNDNFGGPGPGDWGAIRFSATSAGSVLQHTEVRYGGGFFFTGAVQFVGGELNMIGGAITNSLTSGIRVDSGTPNLTSVAFDSNINAAISMNLSSDPKIVGGTYTANGINGVLLDPGSLTADAVWDDPDVVYRLNGDVTVPVGRTLTVAPGQIVKSFTQLGFVASSNLLIDGRLNADGTPNQPIIFTSRRDDSAGGDTNNDLNTSGVKGDWGGIRFSNTSAGNILDYVEVRYAGGQVLSAAVEVNGANLSLSNSVLSDSVEAGLRVTNARPKLTNVAFEDNTGAAIRMDPASDIESLGGLSTSGNGTNAILVDAGTLTADRSWTAADLIYQLGGTVTVNVGSTLAIGDGVRLDMPQGVGLAGTGALNNAGTIRKSTGTGTSTIAPSTVNTGSIVVQSGTLNFTDSLTNNGNGFIRGPLGTALGVSKNLDGNTQNVVKFETQSTIQFRGSGTPVAPQLFEVLSRDQGSTGIGFTDNFAFYSIALSNNTHVRLVDNANNAPGAGAEAVYVNSLSIPSGTSLDLNGLNLYTRATTGTGTVTGGTITVLPDGGPLTIDTLTAGRIAVATEVDDWTFFGRAGQAITVTLATGTASPTPPITPTINFGRVTLSDPDGNSLGTANNTASGQEVSLAGIVLPKDGVYHVKVQAPQTPPTSTGNYILAAWNATVVTSPLVLNETLHGDIDTPFRTDRWTFSGQAGQVFNFKLINTESAAIQFDLTGPNGFTAFSNQSSSVNSVTLPTTGDYALSVHGSQRQTGAYAFRLESVSVTDLTLGTPFNGPIVGGRQSQLFKVNVPETRQLRVTLTDTSATDRNEVYLQFGSAPTRRDFHYKFNTPASANQQVDVPSAAPGDWFILLYTEAAPNPGNITLLAEAASIFLTDVAPKRAGTAAEVVLTLTGVGFDNTAMVSLVAADNTAFPATSVEHDLPTQLTIRFAANSVPVGEYSVRVSKTDGSVALLPGAFTFVQGGEAKLETRVILPSALGYHIPGTLYVEYSNAGEIAMQAPLLSLTPTQTYADGSSRAGAFLTLDQSQFAQGFWTSSVPEGFTHSIQILASGKTPGILQPGEKFRVPVYWAGWQLPFDLTYPAFQFDLHVLSTDSAASVPWLAMKSDLQPSGVSDNAWDGIYPNLMAQLGTTWGNVIGKLDEYAAYLGRLGVRVVDIGELWSFAIQRANGIDPLKTLSSAVDMTLPAVGLPLGIGRQFGSTILDRHVTGPFGNGWVITTWSQSLSVRPDQTVVIDSGDGSQRIFQPDSRSNRYFTQTGDFGTLAHLGAGVYRLTELNGLATQFSDGRVAFVQDPNGNVITAGYSMDRLTSLTASSGQSITLGYNAADRIVTLTNSFNQIATYTYDASNQYLLSVADENGYVTTYTYDTGQAPATKNALLTVTFPDNVTQSFTYDAQGRLEQTSVQDTQTIDFEYGVGAAVAVTTASDSTTNYFYDHRGLLTKVVDPLGSAVTNEFDGAGRLLRATDPLGQIYVYAYDKLGNLVNSRNPLGQESRFTYGPFSQLASVTDPKGNATRFQYDVKGNLLSKTHADGAIESLAYDPVGQLMQSTDANNNVIQYSYNAAGQLTRKTYADSSETVYEYSPTAQLISVRDALGTTTLVYDAANRLTKITYPDDKFLTYTYDNTGRRTQMVDQTGFTVNYMYNSLGQLSGLKDGTNAAIVNYTYDSVGRLKEESKGNGTKTTYTYDAASNVLSIVNSTSDGTANSSFVFNYDALGFASTETTLQGQWDYTYDGIGQLTRAVFTSNNPGQVPSQDLQYVYDAAGNRTSTIINGVTTAYTTNTRNEYTQIGSTANVYDTRGNLISRADALGVTEFTYNADNQLVGIQPPVGLAFDYKYDAFGNLYSTSDNGQTTRVFVDASSGNAVGQFASDGTVLSHFVHGAGLVSQTTGAGVTSYFDFDLRGSTVSLTGPTGTLTNTYSYLPFGGALTIATTVTNPFEFVGRFGVMAAGADLDLMGARFFDPAVGQFLSDDPIGLAGGDINLRRYVSNNPVQFIDPSGLGLGSFLTDIGGKILVTIFGDAEDLVEGDKSGLDVLEDVAVGLVSVEGLPGAGSAIGIAVKNPDATIEGSLRILYEDSPEQLNELDLLKRGIDPATQRKNKLPPAATPTPCQDTDEDPDGEGSGEGSGEGGSIVCERVSGGESSNASSTDPNDKHGPTGFGPNGFVKGDGVFAYRVNFENDKDATAPAQQVRITDQLSENLNWDTFEFTEFGFGDEFITAPQGSQSFLTAVPMTVDGATFDVLITADFFSQTGTVVVLFQSIDPTTELPPDVLVGFLPPEDGTGRGQGYFSYLIEPKSNLATGTEIRNIALITFDSNLPIATNQIDPHDPSQGTDVAKEAINTIDVGVPASHVNPLAGQSPRTFTVTWSGSDDASGPTGSGIATFDVFVSDDAGPWTLWLDDTTMNSSDFTGVISHTYSFYTIATDNVGHIEDKNAIAEATTKVVAGPRWQNANNLFDVTNDGFVSPIDVLIIVNTLNHPELGLGNGPLPTSGPLAPPPFLDTSGDGFVSPIDALLVVNFLNRQSAGESESTADTSGAAMTPSQLAYSAAVDHFLWAVKHERSLFRDDETKSLRSQLVKSSNSTLQSPLSGISHATQAPHANFTKRDRRPASAASVRLSVQVVDEFFEELSEHKFT